MTFKLITLRLFVCLRSYFLPLKVSLDYACLRSLSTTTTNALIIKKMSLTVFRRGCQVGWRLLAWCSSSRRWSLLSG